MKLLHLPYAALAVLMVSCASHNPSAAARPQPAPRPTMMERQVRNAIDAGDGDYQVRVLRARVAAEPENVNVRLELAKAYRERGYAELALEHCRLAAARFPESAPAHLELARSLRAAGMRKDAADELEAFLKKVPQSTPEYLSWVGILRDEMGMWPAGEPAHRAAVELAPKADYLHNNLGYNLLMQGKNEAAAAEFREALRLNPRSAVARNNLGLFLANTDATEQAVLYWQSATDPASAHNNLAAYLIEKRRYAEARKELDTALGYNRQHPAALKNLELVSRLDGKPATLTMQRPAETRWVRMKSSIRKLFVGPLQNQPAATAKPSAVSAE
jgi:Flp pilus assembly protein TadD